MSNVEMVDCLTNGLWEQKVNKQTHTLKQAFDGFRELSQLFLSFSSLSKSSKIRDSLTTTIGWWWKALRTSRKSMPTVRFHCELSTDLTVLQKIDLKIDFEQMIYAAVVNTCFGLLFLCCVFMPRENPLQVNTGQIVIISIGKWKIEKAFP